MSEALSLASPRLLRVRKVYQWSFVPYLETTIVTEGRKVEVPNTVRGKYLMIYPRDEQPLAFILPEDVDELVNVQGKELWYDMNDIVVKGGKLSAYKMPM